MNWGKAQCQHQFLSYILVGTNQRYSESQYLSFRFRINNLDQCVLFRAFYIRWLLLLVAILRTGTRSGREKEKQETETSHAKAINRPQVRQRNNNVWQNQIYKVLVDCRCLKVFRTTNFMWVCRWPEDDDSSCRQ